MRGGLVHRTIMISATLSFPLLRGTYSKSCLVLYQNLQFFPKMTGFVPEPPIFSSLQFFRLLALVLIPLSNEDLKTLFSLSHLSHDSNFSQLVPFGCTTCLLPTLCIQKNNLRFSVSFHFSKNTFELKFLFKVLSCWKRYK